MTNKDVTEKLKQITDYKSVLVIAPAKVISDTDLATLKLLTNNKNISCVYLSFNKTYKSILENLKKSKIDISRISIIDCVSSSKNLIEKSVYTTSINNLANIEILIESLIKNKTWIVIDDIATLLIYHTKEIVAKFIRDLTSRFTGDNLKLVILTTYVDENLMDKIVPVFDKVIEIKS